MHKTSNKISRLLQLWLAFLGPLFTIDVKYTLKVVIHLIIIDQWNQTALVRNPGKGHLEPRYSYRCDVRVPCKAGYLEKLDWEFELANSVDPDQMSQNAASEQGLSCLLK